MTKISKTAAASMRGGPAEIKRDPFDTNEKKIRELRVQRENKLSVVRYDFIDALFVEFDLLTEAVKALASVNADLTLERDAAIKQSKGDLALAGAIDDARDQIVSQRDRALRGVEALQRDLAAANTSIETLEGDINILRLQLQAALSGNSTEGQ